MKTINERARTICESLNINDPYPVEVENVAAILREHTEAVLMRVENLIMVAGQRGMAETDEEIMAAYESGIYSAMCAIGEVKQEVCK